MNLKDIRLSGKMQVEREREIFNILISCGTYKVKFRWEKRLPETGISNKENTEIWYKGTNFRWEESFWGLVLEENGESKEKFIVDFQITKKTKSSSFKN